MKNVSKKLNFIYSLQSISCYGLLSPDPIRNPHLTGSCLILPFFKGCRYAAIPCTRTDGVIQVDIYNSRPESLVYHDHCLHLKDLKVVLSLKFPNDFITCFLYSDSPRYAGCHSKSATSYEYLCPVWLCTLS